MDDVKGDVAFIFKFPPAVLRGMALDELARWHTQARRFLVATDG